MKQVSRMQFITNQWSSSIIPEQIEKVCRGGCRWIQLRLKDKNDEEIKDILSEAKKIRRFYQATLIINDRVDLAIQDEVDGVHLGREDMCPEKARALLGDHKIIGGTANKMEEILELYKKGVDYVGLGPYQYTRTKYKLAPILGLDGFNLILQRMKLEEVHVPIIAIGGIRLNDIPDLMNTGIHGIAVSSLIVNHERPEEMTQTIINHIEKAGYHVKNRE